MMKVILSLGTNLGNRLDNIDKLEHFCTELLSPPIILSQLMETEPIGTPDEQQWYYNRVITGNYSGTVYELLVHCRKIEKTLGRLEKSNRKARTADIDILLADDCILNEPDLIIPHPEILNRRFCIVGIAEIAPHRVHPLENKPFSELLTTMGNYVSEQKVNFIDI